MGWKYQIIKPFAKYTANTIDKLSKSGVDSQFAIFKKLINAGENTVFGKDHRFSEIKMHADFVKNVPIRDYEELKNYIERIKKGELNILWRDKPAYSQCRNYAFCFGPRG